jgi:hypothetical protein
MNLDVNVEENIKECELDSYFSGKGPGGKLLRTR